MIMVKEGILPEALLKKCLYILNKASWSYGWPSNTGVPYGHWNVDLTHTTKNNPTDVSERLPDAFAEVWEIVNKEFFGGVAKLTRCYSNRHTFGTEGYIHTDTERTQDQTCIIYLDEEWNADWGGETNFYNDEKTEIIKSVLPVFGRTAVFPGNIPHCARGLTRICSKVRTTLMFKVTIDPKALYPAEQLLASFLECIGATRLKHNKGTLADHLIRTFHLLKASGANDILALAGGLHSVYGTNAFKHPCVDKDDKRIYTMFGAEVDRIVRLFSTVDRPSSLESPDGSLNETDLFLLRCIECANLYDQDELDPAVYPNLCEFASKFRK
jgi:SM-20-related protein